jgi:hypothetical protein
MSIEDARIIFRASSVKQGTSRKYGGRGIDLFVPMRTCQNY